ncbi:MAG TPA: hypothetical protein VEJ20_05885 [Candidatus Eremiobacteraceae bacterium]|nr:hypothetical protein [Candidatus Eremiobacteraceae bacterium]
MRSASIRRGLFAFWATAVLVIFASGSPAWAGGGEPSGLRPYFIGSVDGSLPKYFTVNLRDGSTARDAGLVAEYFRSFGLAVRVDAEDGLLFVHGTYAQAGAAAHVGFERGVLRGQPFVTIDRGETYPPQIASRVFATTVDDGPMATQSAELSPDFGVADADGYTPADMETYYDFGTIATSGDEGKGQNVAIMTCGTVATTDVSQYESLYGLPSNTPAFVSVDGGSTTGEFAGTLQVERMVGTASKASITLYVLPAACNVGNLADAAAQVVTDDATKHYHAFVTAYGNFEDVYAYYGDTSVLNSESSDLSKLEGKSTTTFAGTGDNGAWSSLEPGDTGVFYPSSDPNAVGVGQTVADSESPTNPTRLFEFGGYYSGGGASTIFAIPTWQKSVTGIISTTNRNTPDVTFNGDCHTLYQVTYEGSNDYFGCGSGFGAASWAGILLLADAERKTDGKDALSGVESILYKERTTSDFYTDITIGCNGYYCSGTGWDAVSGLGSPNASTIYSTLVALPSSS